jgi:hypothetical protein
LVEWFDSDGGCYVTTFDEPLAERRAREYFGFRWASIASARHFFASFALIGLAVFERAGGAVSGSTAGPGRSYATSIARTAALVECIAASWCLLA